jgi:hypothetical protein
MNDNTIYISLEFLELNQPRDINPTLINPKLWLIASEMYRGYHIICISNAGSMQQEVIYKRY